MTSTSGCSRDEEAGSTHTLSLEDLLSLLSEALGLGGDLLDDRGGKGAVDLECIEHHRCRSGQ